MKHFLSVLMLLSLSCYLKAQFGDQQIISPEINVPNSVHPVDLDGDSDLDVLTSSRDDEKIAWFENTDGQGNFSSAKTIFVQTGDLEFVLPADVDGDGDMDILSIVRSPPKLSWFENKDGKGNFGDEIFIYNPPDDIEAMDAKDIDGDSDVDLITVSDNNQRIVWLENETGSGDFGNEKIITETNGNQSTSSVLLLADIDGDNDNDFITSRRDSGPTRLVWLKNQDGLGNFGSEAVISNSVFSVTAIQVGDIDGDNYLDILSAGGTGVSNLIWHKNETGIGDFVSEFNIDSEALNIEAASLIDLDGDNDLDIVVTSEGNVGAHWFENTDGLGTYNDGKKVHDEFAGISYVGTGDFSGDSHPDIIGGTQNSISWIKNTDGTGHFDDIQIITECVVSIRDLTGGDLDGDGDLDLLSANNGGEDLAWFENLDGKGSFGYTNSIREPIFGGRGIITIDMDNDGDLDVVGTTLWGSRLHLYINTDGKGNLENTFDILDMGNSNDLFVTDLDNDGFQDLLIAGGLKWLRNNGAGEFETAPYIINDNFSPYSVFASDMDNDGDLDVVSASYTQDKVSWFENEDGLGNFGPENIIETNLQDTKTAITADLDNDGDKDVIATSGWTNKIFWYENLDGNGTFGVGNLITNAAHEGEAITTSDLDVDGDLDLIFTSNAWGILWIENLGGGTFASSFNSITKDIDNPSHIFVGDFNNDNYPDVASAAYTRKIVWNENNLNKRQLRSGVFWDENENGIKDGSELLLKDQKVFLNPKPNTQWSSDCFTVFPVDTGSYELSLKLPDFWTLTTDSVIQTVVSDTTVVFTENFGIKPNEAITKAEIYITSSPTRCGFTIPMWVYVKNTGTTTIGGEVRLEIDPLTTFIEAQPFPDEINGNILTWSFNDISPTHSDQIGLKLQMPGVDFLGEIVSFSGQVEVQDSGGNPLFSTERIYASQINCSYDPNDKLAEPYNPYHESNYTLFGDDLLYTVRFQNTGTDTAFNVKIEDNIHSDLDLNTMEVTSASHPYEVFFYNNRKVSFEFDNILLPDSSVNFEGSQGFIQFKISPIDSLDENSIISNSAEIFFDFNPPILTNMVENTLVSEYPVILEFSNPACHDGTDGFISADVLGSLPLFYNWNTGENSSVIENLSEGFYSLTVTNSLGQIVADTSLSLTAPPPIIVNSSSTPATTGELNGTATVLVTGGIPPYFFEWQTNPIQTDSVALQLASGDYEVIITDAGGCVIIEKITVEEIVNNLNLSTDSFFEIHPNPATDLVFIELKFSKNREWNIQITNTFGQVIRNCKSDKNSENKIVFNDLPPGTYQASLMIDGRIFSQKFIVLKE